MFDNPGSKIKIISEILFFLSLITFIFLAIIYGFGLYNSSNTFIPVFFFSFLLGGPIVSYISLLLLYGFGELVENSGKESCKTSNSSKPKTSMQNIIVHHIFSVGEKVVLTIGVGYPGNSESYIEAGTIGNVVNLNSNSIDVEFVINNKTIKKTLPEEYLRKV